MKKWWLGLLFLFIGVNVYADPKNPSPPPLKPPTEKENKEKITPSTPLTPPINCNYHITAETNKIDQALIIKWSEKAVTQSFEFNHATLPQQLTALKACYTDLGWQSFQEALEKSGNLKAIETQKLVVSSLVKGQITINEIKENQWKVTVPLQVVYQGEKEKLTQLLNVELTVGRKISGDLGIMQVIASPQQK